MVRYQNTINTNISWIPQIPNHWNLMKVNALFQERKCKVSDKVFSPLSVTKKGILPPSLNMLQKLIMVITGSLLKQVILLLTVVLIEKVHVVFLNWMVLFL